MLPRWKKQILSMLKCKNDDCITYVPPVRDNKKSKVKKSKVKLEECEYDLNLMKQLRETAVPKPHCLDSSIGYIDDSIVPTVVTTAVSFLMHY